MTLPSTWHAGPRFNPGRIFATPGAIDALSRAGMSFITLLIRHLRGDWGDLCDDDRRQNELSLDSGLRLLSCYRLPGGNIVWIITEWDRSSTTLLLPDEY